MTDTNAPLTAPTSPGSSDTAGTVKEQASQVTHDVADTAKDVAGTAKEEAARVAGESKKQAKALYDETRTQLTEQAGAQQQRVASGLRTIGGELARMADSSEQPGVASDVVSQVATRTQGAADWLDARDPGSLLREVRTFARSKPGTFIAVSALAGLVAGRLVRSLASEAHDEKEHAGSGTDAQFTQPLPPVGSSSPSPSPSSGDAAPTDTPVYDATIDGRGL